ncbi:MAG: histidine kinase [Crocinitomicaceae bacterium]
MEPIGISESKQLRIQIILAVSLGSLYALCLFLSAYSWEKALWAGLFILLEIFLAARVLNNVFRYFQPKQTFSFVPFSILILLTGVIGFLVALLVKNLPFAWKPLMYLPSFSIHLLLLFFALCILFYEWWFLKNDVRNQQNTQRLLLLQEDLKNAEIKNIQQNIQPHFLFNSLNSISALTLTEPEEAQKMVVKLSEFLRHSVVKNQKMFVSLREELNQIERYLAIEQIRFSHRLKFVLKHNEENDSLEIPAMILQPLLENAIKFGLYGQTGETLIELNCYRSSHYLHLELSNPVDEDLIDKKGTGFGLSGLRKKLYLLYAQNHLLTTHREGTIFLTTLKIPIEDENDTN